MSRDNSQESDRQKTDQLASHKQPEVVEAAPRGGDVEEIRAADRSHFFAAANAILYATHPLSPQLFIPDSLGRREVEGLRFLYQAQTQRECEEGQSQSAGSQLSALERRRSLNQALIKLQPTLALARSPGFPQARAHIEEIRKRIAKLKDEIARAIILEEHQQRVGAVPKPVDNQAGAKAAKLKKAVGDKAKP